MNRVKLSPANILILAAGALMLIASFMAFYRLPFPGGTLSVNAWDHGLFLIATLPALLGMVMALQVGLVAFGRIDMPNRLLGFTWDQVHLVLALQSALLMGAYFVTAKAPLEFGIGFWLMLVAAIALVVGALMRLAASGRRPRAI
jgi:hypothetical protein